LIENYFPRYLTKRTIIVNFQRGKFLLIKGVADTTQRMLNCSTPPAI
jgi:hypothetical protein